ncbi:MAG: hypothetical protein LHW60_02360 [Candidatus Cloacimonetes bacterium]|nr:hypothetical protein [Candidatus Cloacimonadota bacterium]NLO44475.1 hypothetical protein [Candidatus Cloacimonadota bacterium]
MKKSLSCLIIFLLSSNLALFALSKDVEFFLYNSSVQRLVESRLYYQMHPLKGIGVDILGQSSWENRLSFNRDTHRSNLGTNISYNHNKLFHTLAVDYESYQESSDLDPGAYVNKNGKLGYLLYFAPIDSLFLRLESYAILRNEHDRWSDKSYLNSDGLQFTTAMGYRYDEEIWNLNLRANADNKNMNWEKYTDLQASAGFGLYPENFYWSNTFHVYARKDNIFTLSNQDELEKSSYLWQDKQKRRGFSTESKLIYIPHPDFIVNINESYYERVVAMEESITRDNKEHVNELSLGLNYDLPADFVLKVNAEHSLAVKDFIYDQNTRDSERRGLNGVLAWEYSQMDTLLVGAGINLQRTKFPKNENLWDNDLRTRSLRVGWLHYFRERIRTSNLFIYSLREDVYIDPILSANNHVLESYSMLPDMEILLGDRLAFKQSYQIRTDYTNFIYPQNRENKLYRQLGYKFNLIFDSYPYLARVPDDRWNQLNHRKVAGSSMLLDLCYGYEENQYGQQKEEYYTLDSKNRKYLSSITLKRDIGNFYYSISPGISWGTWTEYSLEAGIYWTFDNGSFIEASITPNSEDLIKIDWRTSVNLNIYF